MDECEGVHSINREEIQCDSRSTAGPAENESIGQPCRVLIRLGKGFTKLGKNALETRPEPGVFLAGRVLSPVRRRPSHGTVARGDGCGKFRKGKVRMFADFRRNVLVPAVLCVAGTCVLVVAGAQEPANRTAGTAGTLHSGRTDHVVMERDRGWMRSRFLPRGMPRTSVDSHHIDPGDPASAELHYKDAAMALGLPDPGSLDRLDSLLMLAGYAGLTAEHVAGLDSAILMDPVQLSEAANTPREALSAVKAGDILATRFFSPKTTDVSGRQQPRQYSWRKLVRLKVLAGSRAAERGFTSLWVLTNTYEADLSRNPFHTANSNFQAILQPGVHSEYRLPVFFFAFGPLPDAARVVASEASWDAGNETLGNPQGNTEYHPPIACIQCHGGDTRFARLQYLDTDHWLDRVQSDDDFAPVGASAWPALFDAGRDSSSEAFALSFDVVRQLNREILAQNEAVDALARQEASDQGLPDSANRAADSAVGVSFQTRAAANWLRLHENSAAHIPPALRGFAGDDGVTRWNPESPDEVKLAGLLNRFCFRCHSSVRFHVFDKQAVQDVHGTFAYHLDSDLSHGDLRMPQDRTADDAVFTIRVRAEMVSLSERIFDRPVADHVLRRARAARPFIQE